jgi:hypothetical protein
VILGKYFQESVPEGVLLIQNELKDHIKEETMDKAETNGYLKAVELQLRAVEDALTLIEREGVLDDPAYETFRKVKVDLVNLTQKFTEVRGWNR